MLFASDLPSQLLPWLNELSNHFSPNVRPWHSDLCNPDTKAVLPKERRKREEGEGGGGGGCRGEEEKKWREREICWFTNWSLYIQDRERPKRHHSRLVGGRFNMQEGLLGGFSGQTQDE